jgi:hypothetical protein
MAAALSAELQCHAGDSAASVLSSAAASEQHGWFAAGCAAHHLLSSMYAVEILLQVLPELSEHVWQHIAYLVPQCRDPQQQSVVQQLLFGGYSAAVVLDDAAQLDALQACLDVVGVVRACLHKRPLRRLEISRSMLWRQQSKQGSVTDTSGCHSSSWHSCIA